MIVGIIPNISEKKHWEKILDNLSQWEIVSEYDQEIPQSQTAA